MSASLVGSEMCIRDRTLASPVCRPRVARRAARLSDWRCRCPPTNSEHGGRKHVPYCRPSGCILEWCFGDTVDASFRLDDVARGPAEARSAVGALGT
eukprot:764739-Alexandrium_andersonii.AAC.1